jgi:molybdate transport system ATP-binding protein
MSAEETALSLEETALSLKETASSELVARIQLSRGTGFRLDVDTRLSLQGLTAIYGPSGCGKTSLLYSLAGLLRGEGDSEICFAGRHWQRGENFLPTHRRKIGFVFQDARLFPHLSVAGNLDYALRRRHNPAGPSLEQACAWLQLEELLPLNAGRLSAGQQQRVAIARALLSAPDLLLLDEPLANIDLASRRQILGHLGKLQRESGIPMLYVSHEMEEVARLADWLLVMEQGRISAAGPLLELCSQMDLALAHEEQAAAIITATLRSQDREYGLSELALADQQLFVSTVEAPIDSQVRLRIPARDISLCLEAPRQTSIQNILRAVVCEIEPGSGERLLLRLQVDKQFLLARLTRKSIAQLHLQVGMAVYAQVKSAALISDFNKEA